VIYLAYFVIGFTVLQLLVALINLVFREKPESGEISGSPMVSVLIPARNEEKNIPNILCDLQNQAYRNIEVIVFNDMSDDRTAEIVAGFGKEDNRIRIINSTALPEGWTGKNYACHSLADAASGEYFLFIDADVRLSGKIICDMIHMAEKKGLSLISIFPKQMTVSVGEKISVPDMNLILLTLLPLVFVRKLSFPSLSAANGQFMFFRSGEYREIKPHAKLRDDKVEDIGISRLFKRNNLRIACLTGNSTVECRMYTGLCEAIEGFSKNVGAFFGNSLILAFLFWLVTTLGFIPVLVLTPLPLFMLYILLFFMVRILVAIASEQEAVENLLYCIPMQFILGIFIYKAILNKYSGGYVWKGRKVK
jgi:hypothetical protein